MPNVKRPQLTVEQAANAANAAMADLEAALRREYAVGTSVSIKDKDGSWRVVGYFQSLLQVRKGGSSDWVGHWRVTKDE